VGSEGAMGHAEAMGAGLDIIDKTRKRKEGDLSAFSPVCGCWIRGSRKDDGADLALDAQPADDILPTTPRPTNLPSLLPRSQPLRLPHLLILPLALVHLPLPLATNVAADVAIHRGVRVAAGRGADGEGADRARDGSSVWGWGGAGVAGPGGAGGEGRVVGCAEGEVATWALVRKGQTERKGERQGKD
jgi:hypothetical protein